MVDSNTSYTIYQNIPPSHSSSHLPTRSHSRISSSRIPPLTVTLSIQESRPKTCSSASIPSREACPSPPTRARFLRRHSASLRWSCRILDEMVSRLARSLGLGSNVHSRREKVVHPSNTPRILGITSCNIRRRMESTIGQSKAA